MAQRGGEKVKFLKGTGAKRGRKTSRFTTPTEREQHDNPRGARLETVERDASGDEALTIAKSAALVRLDEDELEVVEQVLASVEVMENRQELELVLEGLEASVGDIPRLNLVEKYATFAEEEYRLLRQQKEGEA